MVDGREAMLDKAWERAEDYRNPLDMGLNFYDYMMEWQTRKIAKARQSFALACDPPPKPSTPARANTKQRRRYHEVEQKPLKPQGRPYKPSPLRNVMLAESGTPHRPYEPSPLSIAVMEESGMKHAPPPTRRYYEVEQENPEPGPSRPKPIKLPGWYYDEIEQGEQESGSNPFAQSRNTPQPS